MLYQYFRPPSVVYSFHGWFDRARYRRKRTAISKTDRKPRRYSTNLNGSHQFQGLLPLRGLGLNIVVVRPSVRIASLLPQRGRRRGGIHWIHSGSVDTLLRIDAWSMAWAGAPTGKCRGRRKLCAALRLFVLFAPPRTPQHLRRSRSFSTGSLQVLGLPENSFLSYPVLLPAKLGRRSMRLWSSTCPVLMSRGSS